MYLALKHFHLTCVVLSIVGLIGWGLVVHHRLALPRARLTRNPSHLVDSCLLASAPMASDRWLRAFVMTWLTAKIGGLLPTSASPGPQGHSAPGAAGYRLGHAVRRVFPHCRSGDHQESLEVLN